MPSAYITPTPHSLPNPYPTSPLPHLPYHGGQTVWHCASRSWWDIVQPSALWCDQLPAQKYNQRGAWKYGDWRAENHCSAEDQTRLLSGLCPALQRSTCVSAPSTANSHQAVCSSLTPSRNCHGRVPRSLCGLRQMFCFEIMLCFDYGRGRRHRRDGTEIN